MSTTEHEVVEPGQREQPQPHPPIRILINNKPYTAPQATMTVAALKALAGLPSEFDCYQVVHNQNVGPLPDTHVLELHSGDRFVIVRSEEPA